ncbi:unnamed protein product [Cylicocyclus nassatus]|uniref:C2H2-type domain-containing protein n=1 Tax=Cylicocyclus nassatus TaxID=53992 RepID=A0AA36GTG9_CYLNA|nr:unnamed protein product [Cylicocyclus nassatus]
MALASAMDKFVVVRVQDELAMKLLIDKLDDLMLSYNICSEDNLKAPCEPSCFIIEDDSPSDSVAQAATATVEVVQSGDEIDLDKLLQHTDDDDKSKSSDKPWKKYESQISMQWDGSLAMTPVTLGSGRRKVPNNIKRYRRQVCKICNSSNSVPFLRSKMLHAATHSDFKRYKCPHCDKRGASTATVTLHIKSKHPGQPPNEFLDEMNQEEYMRLLLLTEKCFDDPYV